MDYVSWSENIAEAVYFHNEVFSGVDAQGKELWIIGDLSERAVLEFTNLSWDFHVQNSIDATSWNFKEGKTTQEINKRAFDILNKKILTVKIPHRNLINEITLVEYLL